MKKIYVRLMSLAFVSALIANPFGFNVFELQKIHFLSIFLALSLITIGIKFIHTEKIEVAFNKSVYMLVGLWVISLIASTVLSIEPTLSFWGSEDRLQGLFSHLIYLGFFFLFLNLLRDKKSQEMIIKMIIGVGIFASLHAILQQFGMFTFFGYAMDEFIGRSFAAFGHPNMLGQFLILPIWGAFYFITQVKNKKRVLLIMGLLVLLSGLFVTQNRASILGVSIGVIIAAIIYAPRRLKYFIITLTGIGVFGFVFFVAPNISSITARGLLWKGAFNLLFENSIFGSGLETFKIIFQKVVDPKIFELEQLYYFTDRAHNEWLDIAVMQGFFGLAIFTTIIGSIYYKFIRYFKKNIKDKLLTIMICGLTSVLVSNLFSFNLTVHYLGLSVIFSIIINRMIRLKRIELRLTKKFIPILIVVLIISGSLISISTRAIYSNSLTFIGIKELEKNMDISKIELLERSIQISPQQEDAYMSIIQSLALLGSISGDDNYLYKAKEYNHRMGLYTGKTFVYYMLEGDINSILGNKIESEKAYSDGINMSPQNPLLIRAWANKYYIEGDFKKAIEKNERFLKLVPEYWKWKKDLKTRTLEEQEKYRLFFKSIPDFSNIFMQLSESYKETGDIGKSNYYKEFI